VDPTADKDILLILETLIPKRRRVVQEFVLRFDALVWVELDGQQLPVAKQQGIRDRLLKPILKANATFYTTDLVNLALDGLEYARSRHELPLALFKSHLVL